MRFWDSSAVVPLLVLEASGEAVVAESDADPDLIASWGTPIECPSALALRARDGDLTAEGTSVALSVACRHR